MIHVADPFSLDRCIFHNDDWTWQIMYGDSYNVIAFYGHGLLVLLL